MPIGRELCLGGITQVPNPNKALPSGSYEFSTAKLATAGSHAFTITIFFFVIFKEFSNRASEVR